MKALPLLATLISLFAVSSLAEQPSTWTIHKQKSEMDDTENTASYLSAENEVAGLGGKKNRPILGVQCLGDTQVRLVLLSDVGFEYYIGYTTLMRIRFDDNKAQEQQWSTFSCFNSL